MVDLECGPAQPTFYIYCTVVIYNVYCMTHSRIRGIYFFRSHKKKLAIETLGLAQKTSPYAKPWAKVQPPESPNLFFVLVIPYSKGILWQNVRK